MLIVITITYNDISGLKKTCDSLSYQNNRDFLQIIIDGASKDGTLEYLKQFDDVPNIEYLSEEDNGIYDAMEKGIKKYKTIRDDLADYILFLNSGDFLYSPESIQKIYEMAANNDSDIMLFDVYEDFSGKLFYKKSRKVNWIPLGMPTSHQAMLFKSTVFDSVQLDKNFKYSGDYDLLCKAYVSGLSIVNCDDAFSVFDKSGISEVNRISALKENYKIRREVLSMNRLETSFLYMLHYLHTKFKQKFPDLTKKLRGLKSE